MNRDFKGIFADRKLWLQKGLKCTARCFLIEIDSLDKGDGCWAKNKHFSELFGLSRNRVSEIIKELAAAGLIDIRYLSEEGVDTRFLSVIYPVEKSTTLSKNRLHLSKNRLHLSKNRLPNKRTEYNNEINNDICDTAFSFLKKNHTIKLDVVLMKFKSKIKDWDAFVTYFNNQADEKELKFTDRVLLGRLNNLADTWLRNQSKNNDDDKSVNQLIGKRLA